MSPTQQSLFATSAPPMAMAMPSRLALTLNRREWLDLLADEWWPLTTPRIVRLGVGAPIGGITDQAVVVAWIDPTLLPSVDVLAWRYGRWVHTRLAELDPNDRQVAWSTPIPLTAIVSFSVESESDLKRLVATAKGFDNLALPHQPIEVKPIAPVPPASEDAACESLRIDPPRNWNAARGAATMALWAVPTIDPWLDAACGMFGVVPDANRVRALGVPWLASPPWRRAASDSSNRDERLWQAIVAVLGESRRRDRWRPAEVLDEILRHARGNQDSMIGATDDELGALASETHALLRDERRLDPSRGETDPLGLSLQMVLLRSSPERFVTWKRDLPGLRPGVWWTGAILSGLVEGYKDLSHRYRGSPEASWYLAVHVWESLSETSVRWPMAAKAEPRWTRTAGRVLLSWSNSFYGERPDGPRSRWYSADLNAPEIRRAAIALAERVHTTAVRRRIVLCNASVPLSGAGTVRIDTVGKELRADGEVTLELPASSVLSIDLCDEAFRKWIAEDAISEHLPDPPGGAPFSGIRETHYGRHAAEIPTADDPPGLALINDFVSIEDEQELLRAVDASTWRKDLSRRVQHYGWAYNYRARRIDENERLGPLPAWAVGIAERLVAERVVQELPDQVIVNEYVKKQGISRHIDCIPCFRGPIVMISLCEAWEMIFTAPDGRKVSRILPQRSAVVMSGPVRHEWTHEIPKRLKESWGPRGRRVSLTFRKVNIAPDIGSGRDAR